MSDDAIHNPRAATSEQNEATPEKSVEQPNVTESPAETTSKTLLVEDTASEAVRNTATESVQDPASCQSSYQANQSPARRIPGRPTLKMTKEQFLVAITETTEKLGHVPSYA